jgi:hypothetical protein
MSAPTTTMTGAELRSLTELLGLNVAYLSKRWRATESTVKNWMKGSHEVPHWIADDVNAMVDDTTDRLDTLVAKLSPGDELQTYRTDVEYHDTEGEEAPYNASWHRGLCARAADEVDNVRITYAVPQKQWRREGGEYVRVRDAAV